MRLRFIKTVNKFDYIIQLDVEVGNVAVGIKLFESNDWITSSFDGVSFIIPDGIEIGGKKFNTIKCPKDKVWKIKEYQQNLN